MDQKQRHFIKYRIIKRFSFIAKRTIIIYKIQLSYLSALPFVIPLLLLSETYSRFVS
jgi:hypothetical protein